ncbi:hypothetical protein EV199_4722 [Pseudobacter ginsenosidimutans]|uniref:Uncharacterized protein n=1 Tax=Pseudobacter ginsenosidimutans TaxID=661488 RepID=A0A4Q7MMX3_9BACT|nr:hypothetical protein EV199_4722 [Pseudobacter ginsenosidimutans]
MVTDPSAFCIQIIIPFKCLSCSASNAPDPSVLFDVCCPESSFPPINSSPPLSSMGLPGPMDLLFPDATSTQLN